MDVIRRCKYISNSYYNKGLSQASQRDLSGAAESLKRSLQFDKNNTNARNLLGLVYYEIGEVADSLVQWVLSLNLQPRDNEADRYLNELQRQSGIMESYAQAISKFNQSLSLAQSGSDDLAILQLQKICDGHKHYVRAHMLLGLLYIANNEFPKAYKMLQRVIRIDRGNTLAQSCIDFIKENKSQDSSKKSIKDVFNHDKKTESSEEFIVPEPYRENTGLGTAANIAIGLLIGALSVVFIYLPAYRRNLATQYNKRVISVSNELNAANAHIDDLEEQIKQMQESIDGIDETKEETSDAYTSKLSCFQRVASAISYFRQGDIYTAGIMYAGIDSVMIEDVNDGSGASVEKWYNELNDYFGGDGYKQMTALGDRAYEAEDYNTALNYYELSAAIHTDNPAALYKQGLCYVAKHDTEKAAELFTQVITDYPDSELAEMAKKDRGY